jgi:hypothetical protein
MGIKFGIGINYKQYYVQIIKGHELVCKLTGRASTPIITEAKPRRLPIEDLSSSATWIHRWIISDLCLSSSPWRMDAETNRLRLFTLQRRKGRRTDMLI